MKIILLLNQSYPNGYALPKRFHLYAKGFLKNGHLAKIIIPIPTEKFGYDNNNPIIGTYEEVPFEYSAKKSIRSNRFIQRRYDDIYGMVKAGYLIFNEKPEIIITSNFSILFITFIKMLSIIVPFKLIKEKCEIDYLSDDKITEFQKKSIKVINNFYEGFIFISKHIEEFHIQEIKSKKPYINVPILIDDFLGHENYIKQTTNILYTGTFLERKDGIITILKAFSILIKKYPEYKLILTGSPEKSSSYPEIIKIIETENLRSNIEFTGYLNDVDLKRIILNAELHIITKPHNRQNHYNFSTRIGECLISGRPILATKVGIMGELLEDNTNIFFTDFHQKSIAEKIQYIIEHKEIATKIGNEGRLFALKNFDFEFNTKRMIEFFKIIEK